MEAKTPYAYSMRLIIPILLLTVVVGRAVPTHG